jgi:hypothetical protein
MLCPFIISAPEILRHVTKCKDVLGSTVSGCTPELECGTSGRAEHNTAIGQ